jgi:hypothetical protein
MVYLAGAVKSLEGMIMRRQPNFSLGVAQISTRPWFYSSDKACREISFPRTPLETAAGRAWAWFKEARYV